MRERLNKTSKRLRIINPKSIGILFLILISILFTGCMSIHTAASKGNMPVVKSRLAWGTSPNKRTFWYYDTPLHSASAYGRTKVVKYLVDKGADVSAGNEVSETPLHYAALHGHTQVVEILLDNGAEINQRGANSQTALMDAVSNGQADMVKFLLLHGADVNARGMYGCTPLHIAAFRNDVETGRILLKHGANPNFKCNGQSVPDEFLKSIVYNNVAKRP